MRAVKFDKKTEYYDDGDIYQLYFRLSIDKYDKKLILDLASEEDGRFYHIDSYKLIEIHNKGLYLYTEIGPEVDEDDEIYDPYIPQVQLSMSGQLYIDGVDII